MRVLLGTTNPSKVKRFSDLLKGYDIEFITLRDIEVVCYAINFSLSTTSLFQTSSYQTGY